MALRGASTHSTIVADVQYNARGQRTLIVLGNGVTTTSTSDPTSRRLTRQQVVRDRSGAAVPARDGVHPSWLHPGPGALPAFAESFTRDAGCNRVEQVHSVAASASASHYSGNKQDSKSDLDISISVGSVERRFFDGVDVYGHVRIRLRWCTVSSREMELQGFRRMCSGGMELR
jgi:hypothetical protein